MRTKNVKPPQDDEQQSFDADFEVKDKDEAFDAEKVRKDIDAIHAAYAKLSAEHEQLKAERDRLVPAKKIEPPKPPKPKPIPLPNTAGALLLSVALMLMVRWVLFVVFQEWRPNREWMPYVLNIALAGGFLTAMDAWVEIEFQRFGYLMIPNAMWVAVGAFIYIDQLSGGYLMFGKVAHPVHMKPATIAAIICLLLGSTKFWAWLLNRCMRVLNGDVFR